MQHTIFDISLFGIQISPTWYGLMYAVGFIISYFFMRKYAKLSLSELDSLLFYVFFGVVLGGRIGYVVLYGFDHFIAHPLDIGKIWQGGMSFHGGLIGVLVSIALFSRKYEKYYFDISDPLAVIIPTSLGLGRIGNWINGELPGYTPYDGVFPMIIDGAPHFPSPLLEFILEGVLLGILMFFLAFGLGWLRKKGLLSSVFLIGYSMMRLIAEQFRLPDTHIGYLLGTDWLTLGIVYTFPVLLLGAILLIRIYMTSGRTLPG